MADRRGMFGNYYVGLAAEEAIPFNRFVVIGSTDRYVKVAGANEDVLGAVEEDNRLYNKDRTLRTGWIAHESIPVKATGEVVVELGLGGASKGDYLCSDADGKAVEYTFVTADGAPADNADIQSAIDQRKVIAAKCLEGGDAGDKVRVLILH